MCDACHFMSQSDGNPTFTRMWDLCVIVYFSRLLICHIHAAFVYLSHVSHVYTYIIYAYVLYYIYTYMLHIYVSRTSHIHITNICIWYKHLYLYISVTSTPHLCRKETEHETALSCDRDLHSHKRDIHSYKRDLHSYNRDLHSYTRDLHSHMRQDSQILILQYGFHISFLKSMCICMRRSSFYVTRDR